MMRSPRMILAVLGLLVAGVGATSASAQDPARLHFERLNGLESLARDVVEVNVDGKLLDLAKRVTTKINDADARKVAQAINGLRGVYVRVYNFDKENEYNIADVDAIRSELAGPGWEKLANVRSKRNNQKVDIFTMFSGEKMDGVAVIISDSKSVAVVNVIGMIDIEMLIELSQKGNLRMPKIDVDLGDQKNDPPKKDKE
jgi:hypothetical protein